MLAVFYPQQDDSREIAVTSQSKQLSSKSVAVLDLIAQGHTYEKILALRSDLTYLDIFAAAREALDLAAAAGDNRNAVRLADIRKAYTRAYEKWTDEEDASLVELVQAGESIENIARALQRQPGAIRSRTMKLHLIEASLVSP